METVGADRLRAGSHFEADVVVGKVGLELGVVRVRHVGRIQQEPQGPGSLLDTSLIPLQGNHEDLGRVVELILQRTNVLVDAALVDDVAVHLG